MRPPSTVAAGNYPVSVKVAAEDAKADAKVTLEITGQPKLDISGREGLVSARASAGKESSIPIDGDQYRHRAGREHQALRQRAERLEGRVQSEDHRRIAPNQHKEVQALITPPDKAIAGDYVTTITADSRGENGDANFRITVTTSTLWGIAGVGIIGMALLIMVGAVARFGRR